MKDRWKCRNNGMRGRKKGTHIWWHSNRKGFFFFSKTSRKLTLAGFFFFFTDEDPKILVPWVPAWYLISSACEHGPCYNGQLVYAPSMPRLTHLDRARAKRNLKLVFHKTKLQLQVAEQYGQWLSIQTVQNRFHITNLLGRPRRPATTALHTQLNVEEYYVQR